MDLHERIPAPYLDELSALLHFALPYRPPGPGPRGPPTVSHLPAEGVVPWVACHSLCRWCSHTARLRSRRMGPSRPAAGSRGQLLGPDTDPQPGSGDDAGEEEEEEDGHLPAAPATRQPSAVRGPCRQNGSGEVPPSLST